MDLKEAILDEAGSQNAWDMSGYIPVAEETFRAAAFLSGHKRIPNSEDIRRFLKEHGDDIEPVALRCYGIEPSPENIKALQAVTKLLAALPEIQKSEVSVRVEPGNVNAEETAELVQRAYASGTVEKVSLKGKHAKNTLVAKDPVTNKIFLLKPGSGKQSPAAGVNEETATQTQREVAFWHLSNILELSDFYPRTDWLKINGQEIACIELLPNNFQHLDAAKKKTPHLLHQVIEKYSKVGDLHKLAVLDWLAGNPDSHGHNAFVSDDLKLRLIDHGSAFAGYSFSPAFDANSFIPFYLRATVPNPKEFDQAPKKEKLQWMPTASPDGELNLKEWLDRIDINEVSEVVKQYSINPQPIVDRWNKLLFQIQQSSSISRAINELWVST